MTIAAENATHDLPQKEVPMTNSAAPAKEEALSPKRSTRAKSAKSVDKKTKTTLKPCSRKNLASKKNEDLEKSDEVHKNAPEASPNEKPAHLTQKERANEPAEKSVEESAGKSAKALALRADKDAPEALDEKIESMKKTHDPSVVVLEPASLQTPEAIAREALFKHYQERMQIKHREDYEAFLKQRQLARLAEKPEAVKKVFRRTSRGNIKAEIRPRAYASEKMRLLALISIPECVRVLEDLAEAAALESLWEELAFLRRVSTEDLKQRILLFHEEVTQAFAKGYFEEDFQDRLKRLERIEAMEKDFARRQAQQGRNLLIDEINEVTCKYGEEALARLEILQKCWARGMPFGDIKDLQESDARVREERRIRHEACIEKKKTLEDKASDSQSEQGDIINVCDLLKEGRQSLAHERAIKLEGMSLGARVLHFGFECAQSLNEALRTFLEKAKSLRRNGFKRKKANTCFAQETSITKAEGAPCEKIGPAASASIKARANSFRNCFGFLNLAACAALLLGAAASFFGKEVPFAVVDEKAAREVLLEMAQGETLEASMAASEGFEALFAAALARTALECKCVIIDSRAVLTASDVAAYDKTDRIKALVREAARSLAGLRANPAQPDYVKKVQSAVQAARPLDEESPAWQAAGLAVRAAGDFGGWLALRLREACVLFALEVKKGNESIESYLKALKQWAASALQSALDWFFPRFGVHEDSFAARALRQEEKRQKALEKANEQRRELIDSLVKEAPEGILSSHGERP